MDSAPHTYTVIDTETHHFKNAFVLQFGVCQVVDDEIVGTHSLNVIPPPHIEISESAVEVHGLTREKLEKTGSAHEDILPEIRETVIQLGQQGPMMGQNFTFDTRALNSTMKHAGLKPIDFDVMEFIDVGVTFKAHRLQKEWNWGDKARRLADGGTMGLHQFFRYIADQRIRGLKWNIDFCMEWFKVEADARGDHDAGEDCRLTHLIYQKMLEQGIIEEVLFAR